MASLPGEVRGREERATCTQMTLNHAAITCIINEEGNRRESTLQNLWVPRGVKAHFASTLE